MLYSELNLAIQKKIIRHLQYHCLLKEDFWYVELSILLQKNIQEIVNANFKDKIYFINFVEIKENQEIEVKYKDILKIKNYKNEIFYKRKYEKKYRCQASTHIEVFINFDTNTCYFTTV